MEIGNYIRTKKNYYCDTIAIRKIIGIDEEDKNMLYIDLPILNVYKEEMKYVTKEDIELYGNSILNVLKKRDIVCGYNDIEDEVHNIGYKWLSFDDESLEGLTDFEIKSVIPREQFEELKYKVGD